MGMVKMTKPGEKVWAVKVKMETVNLPGDGCIS